MPLLDLLLIRQTPLPLPLRLANRHQKVLLARLLLVRRTLALSTLLLLGPSSRTAVVVLVVFRVALGLADLLLLGHLVGQAGQALDLVLGEGVVVVALRGGLLLLFDAAALVPASDVHVLVVVGPPLL